MRPHIFIISSIILLFAASVKAKENLVPEPFRGDSQSVAYTINYDDITALLRATVVNTGMSKRTKAKKAESKIGSRIKTNVKRRTDLEGNRFYFETFETQKQKAIVTNIRISLENLPSEAPLSQFHKSEQLAYWLNLYNITLIDELLKIYPKRSLEDFVGENKKSILNKKLLTVAGLKLSLNDIHHKILMPKYNNDPRILYGLYQGIIGGPNIRRTAYTGDNVYKNLKDNAYEFINSNRGTFFDSKNTFRTSSLYERNKDYFANFKTDLTNHLYEYLIGDMRYNLEKSKKIRTNINNWSMTDLYGSMRKSSSGAATNEAALMDSMGSVSNPLVAGISGLSGLSGVFTQGPMFDTMSKLSMNYGRFTPEQTLKLRAINERRVINLGTVDIADIETENNN